MVFLHESQTPTSVYLHRIMQLFCQTTLQLSQEVCKTICLIRNVPNYYLWLDENQAKRQSQSTENYTRDTNTLLLFILSSAKSKPLDDDSDDGAMLFQEMHRKTPRNRHHTMQSVVNVAVVRAVCLWREREPVLCVYFACLCSGVYVCSNNHYARPCSSPRHDDHPPYTYVPFQQRHRSSDPHTQIHLHFIKNCNNARHAAKTRRQRQYVQC